MSSDPQGSPSTVPTIESPAHAASGQSPGPIAESAPTPQDAPADGAGRERVGASRIRIGSQRPGADRVQARPQLPNTPVPEAPPPKKYPPPNKRNQLSPELEVELAEALGGMTLEEIVKGADGASSKAEILPESRHRARVIKVHREDVFLEMGERNQGIMPLKQFPQPPEPGMLVEVIVNSFDPEEGLYLVSMPGTAVSVSDWSALSEGILVDAKITGHNKGGLECEVSNIRGFIPAGQISIYRIEDFSTLVGERLLCLVTEANPGKRNLILSRRAVLEREQAEAKEKLMAELAPGQIREGVVRSLRDFGAFVDLGGVDGMLHISQLSWARVKHPSEVLQLGQTVKVKIQKIDPETGKISLAMKDLTESPWTNATSKYPVRSTVEGRVSKIMEFGAFVELEPGIEGLVHISELSHQRVWRVADVVEEGQQVEAQVVSVDIEKQRIGLSIKACLAKPAPVKKDGQPAEEEVETPPAPMPVRKTPLKGGVGGGSGGDQFGLNW